MNPKELGADTQLVPFVIGMANDEEGRGRRRLGKLGGKWTRKDGSEFFRILYFIPTES